MADLGTQIIEFMISDEIGIILLAFCLAGVVKFVWKKKLAELFSGEFEEKKFFVFGGFALFGFILWFVGANQIVKTVGLAIIGVALSSIVFECWKDYIHPFISKNTSRAIITVLGLLLFLFAGTLQQIFQFPAILSILIGVVMMFGAWFSIIQKTVQELQERYPSLRLR